MTDITRRQWWRSVLGKACYGFPRQKVGIPPSNLCHFALAFPHRTVLTSYFKNLYTVKESSPVISPCTKKLFMRLSTCKLWINTSKKSNTTLYYFCLVPHRGAISFNKFKIGVFESPFKELNRYYGNNTLNIYLKSIHPFIITRT